MPKRKACCWKFSVLPSNYVRYLGGTACSTLASLSELSCCLRRLAQRVWGLFLPWDQFVVLLVSIFKLQTRGMAANIPKVRCELELKASKRAKQAACP